MQIIVTGCAGFIGYHLCQFLLKRGDQVIGIDNLNAYYDINLKQARLNLLTPQTNFVFHQGAVEDKDFIDEVFSAYPQTVYVVHLAAQAGVRYSLIDPYSYINSNIMGHVTLLEACKKLPHFKHFLYASSSSVYGANTKLPFATSDAVDHPISLYAASKRACELISHCYDHLFNIAQTGFRFFTVYGPWGRPDMATYLFTQGILNDQPISVYNFGKMRRNFTYIDDIIMGLINCIDVCEQSTDMNDKTRDRIYNLGNNKSEDLMDFISTLEKVLNKKAIINLMPLQSGDVVDTVADITATQRDFDFKPCTDITEGLTKFVEWYKSYYKL